MSNSPSTISELASHLKLSKGTVSRILNDKGAAFSEETRQRVFAAAQETGYRPHPVARALATGRTGFVGLWVQDLRTSYHALVAHEMEDRLERSGYQVFITLYGKTEPTAARFGFPSPVIADGIIAHEIFGAGWDALSGALAGRIPIVTTGAWSPPESLDYVAVDLHPASLAAVRHLVASGRRRIAHLTYLLQYRPGGDRYEAYKSVMEESGLPTEFIETPALDRAVVRTSVRAYFETKGCPEAIFCHNDDAAVAVCRAAYDLGIEIPGDLALVGCDGITDAEYLPRPLTTLVQPLKAVCEAATRFLESRRAEPDGPPQRITLPAELVIRESSRP